MGGREEERRRGAADDFICGRREGEEDRCVRLACVLNMSKAMSSRYKLQ